VVGRTVLLNGEPRVIIGVLPRAVRVTYPLDTDAYTLRPAGPLFSQVIAYQVVARLAADVSAAGATASLSRIIESGVDAVRPILAAVPLQERVTRWKATGIWLVAMAAAILCLAACANATMLLLTRTVRRLRDVGVRLALGASHWRILRQALLESLVVGVCGTTLGVLLAGVLVPFIVWLAPPEIPRIDEIALDGGVLAFAVAVGLTCSLAVGLVSWRVMRSARGVLTAGQLGQTATTGRRTLAWRRTLLATQTAMLVVLLSAAGLLLHSFWNVWRIDLGFRPEGVTVISMMTAVVDPRAEHSEPSRRMARTLAELRRVLADTAGVTSAALGQSAPFARSCSTSWVPQSRSIDVSQQPRVSSDVCSVSDGYLELLGVDVVRGRSFTSDDVLDNRRVAIVSTSLAERYFEGESALGRVVHWGEEYEVVGVVGDVRWAAPEDAPRPAIYLPWVGQDSMVAHVVVRSSLPTTAVAAIARETVRRIDPLQPIDRVVSMDEIVADATVERRFHALATGGFGVLALLLGAVGIFGGVAASVAERLREVGIRMALGATAARVRWFAMRHSLLPVAGGLLVGALCAAWTTRLLERFLFGVSAADVPTLGAITVIIAAVALVAAWVPAQRAVRTNPADVLRQE
jgi:putative ABC transport system permease protein